MLIICLQEDKNKELEEKSNSLPSSPNQDLQDKSKTERNFQQDTPKEQQNGLQDKSKEQQNSQYNHFERRKSQSGEFERGTYDRRTPNAGENWMNELITLQHSLHAVDSTLTPQGVSFGTSNFKKSKE